MKLVGSKTEQDFREVLIESHKLLFEGNTYQELLEELKSNFPQMRTAYFVKHIPEQGEDIYTMLINLDIVATVVIDRFSQNKHIAVGMCSINDYVKGLSKIEQIKLAVALDLAKKDI